MKTIKRKNLIAHVSGLIAFALAPSHAAEADQTFKGGVIYGQVSNQVTNQNLENVQVRLAETNQSSFTNRNGAYQFSGLSPGDYTLVVEYAGLDPQRIKVAVGSGRVQTDIPLNSSV